MKFSSTRVAIMIALCAIIIYLFAGQGDHSQVDQQLEVPNNQQQQVDQIPSGQDTNSVQNSISYQNPIDPPSLTPPVPPTLTPPIPPTPTPPPPPPPPQSQEQNQVHQQEVQNNQVTQQDQSNQNVVVYSSETEVNQQNHNNNQETPKIEQQIINQQNTTQDSAVTQTNQGIETTSADQQNTFNPESQQIAQEKVEPLTNNIQQSHEAEIKEQPNTQSGQQIHIPITEQPAAQIPPTQIPVTDIPMTEQQPNEVPVAEEPVAEDPAATDDPTATEEPPPVAEETAAIEDPTATEEPPPVAEEPAAAEEPTTTKEPPPAAEEPAAEEPAAAEDPTATKEPPPAAEEPATEEPAVEEPASEEPVDGQSLQPPAQQQVPLISSQTKEQQSQTQKQASLCNSESGCPHTNNQEKTKQQSVKKNIPDSIIQNKIDGVNSQQIADDKQNFGSKSEPVPLIESQSQQVYTIASLLMQFQSILDSLIRLSKWCIVYLHDQWSIPFPLDHILFVILSWISFTAPRYIIKNYYGYGRVSQILCLNSSFLEKQRQYAKCIESIRLWTIDQCNKSSNNKKFFLQSLKQLKNQVEFLRKQVKTMKEQHRHIQPNNQPNIQQQLQPNQFNYQTQIDATEIAGQIHIPDYSQHFKAINDRLSQNDAHFKKLSKQIEQSSSDQQQFQAVTMQAIQKIYESISNIDQGFTVQNQPPSPSNNINIKSNNEGGHKFSGGHNSNLEESQSDGGLFTPTQNLNFDQSQSGNGASISNQGHHHHHHFKQSEQAAAAADLQFMDDQDNNQRPIFN